GEGHIDGWRSLIRQKDELVTSLRQAKYIDLLPSYNAVTYLEGRARFMGGSIRVDGDLLNARKVIIATGASPSLPPIPGMTGVPYLTRSSALEIDQLPESLLVIGGGYVGCELAQMFARAGVTVTIADIVPILSAVEPDISKALAGYLRDEGIVI